MRISINRLLTSHGRGGLEGDRPSSSLEHQTRAEVQHIASAPTAHRRSRALPSRYRLHPPEEVWSSPIPPAPSSIKPARKFSISPPPRPRTAEAGKSRHSTALAHPKRPGVPLSPQLPRASNPRGSSAYRLHPDRAPQKPEIPTPVPPSPTRRGLVFPHPPSSLEHHTRAEVQHMASGPTAHRRSRKIPPRYRLRPSEEAWCSPIPPAPSSIKPARKFSISPPPRPRTAEAGNPPGTVFAHPEEIGTDLFADCL